MANAMTCETAVPADRARAIEGAPASPAARRT